MNTATLQTATTKLQENIDALQQTLSTPVVHDIDPSWVLPAVLHWHDEQKGYKNFQNVVEEYAKSCLTIDSLRSLQALCFEHHDSPLTRDLTHLKTWSHEEKKTRGKALNQMASNLHGIFKICEEAIHQLQKIQEQYAKRLKISENLTHIHRDQDVYEGRLHPLSYTMDRIIHTMGTMGFTWVDGPEVENVRYNFDALNVDADHPSRAAQDTFYVGSHIDASKPHGSSGDDKQDHALPSQYEGWLLRTQTSPAQIRAMQSMGLPIKMTTLGRVYRRDSDATHSPMFHQVEGLYVDKHVTMQDLYGDIQRFLTALFGREMKIRFRPSFFPFTEPSAEVDMWWGNKHDGRWLEVMGCGMVHPHVLEPFDPHHTHQGYAFGMGVDRLAMLLCGVNDLRDFFHNDGLWLERYGRSPMFYE